MHQRHPLCAHHAALVRIKVAAGLVRHLTASWQPLQVPRHHCRQALHVIDTACSAEAEGDCKSLSSSQWQMTACRSELQCAALAMC